MIPWGRKQSTVVDVPQPAPAPVGASFGPWADHNPRCTCNVCR